MYALAVGPPEARPASVPMTFPDHVQQTPLVRGRLSRECVGRGRRGLLLSVVEGRRTHARRLHADRPAATRGRQCRLINDRYLPGR
jgi:hypothetical protein